RCANDPPTICLSVSSRVMSSTLIRWSATGKSFSRAPTATAARRSKWFRRGASRLHSRSGMIPMSEGNCSKSTGNCSRASASRAAHAEFIRNALDGHFYFLEVAARVGGAYTAETLEAASGVNLWREWARIETSDTVHPYQLPPVRREYGGIAVSLARQESPDTAAYDDPEIVHRIS